MHVRVEMGWETYLEQDENGILQIEQRKSVTADLLIFKTEFSIYWADCI